MTTPRPPRRRPDVGSRPAAWLNWVLGVLIVLFHIVAFVTLAWVFDVFWPEPAPPDAVPHVQISPSSGSVGTLINVQGDGWQPGDDLIVCLDDLGDPAEPPVYARVRANDAGDFQAAFFFPQDVAWKSVPDIPVVVESRAQAKKSSATFRLVGSTPTPLPTAVPTATALPPTATPPCVYAANFVTDMTIPDDTVLQPGASFVKTWRLRNAGSCTWPSGTTAAFVGGAQMNGPASVPVPSVGPQAYSNVTVFLNAPVVAGTHTGYWQLRLPDGRLFGPRFFVRIRVPEPTPTPTPTPGPVSMVWQGAYFDNPTLTGLPVLVRHDARIDFNWGFGSPGTAVPSDSFSARWMQTLLLEPGTYRLAVRVDDGVRVFVDGTPVIDEWHAGSADRVYEHVLALDGWHTLVVEYFEEQYAAEIHFEMEWLGA